MSESAREDAELELEELAAVSPERMGWFRFYFDDHRWEWSEQVQRLHGYRPGTVTRRYRSGQDRCEAPRDRRQPRPDRAGQRHADVHLRRR